MKPEEAAFRVMFQATKTIQECGELVIVGGWVPDLHYPKQGHAGSIDVDMVLDPDSFPPEVNLHDHLLRSGYTKSVKPTPTRYLYSVPGLDKDVAVDLLTTPQHRGVETPSIEIGGLNIESLPGLDLALRYNEQLTIEAVDINGEVRHLTAKVTRPEAFILIKAFPLSLRKKPKDAYDIAFVLNHYQPSLHHLAVRMAPLIQSGSGKQAYEILLEHFRFVGSEGPEKVASFADDIGMSAEQMQQSAFQDAQDLFHWINIANGNL